MKQIAMGLIGVRPHLTPLYLRRQSLGFDLRILWMTFVKVLRRDGVSH